MLVYQTVDPKVSEHCTSLVQVLAEGAGRVLLGPKRVGPLGRALCSGDPGQFCLKPLANPELPLCFNQFQSIFCLNHFLVMQLYALSFNPSSFVDHHFWRRSRQEGNDAEFLSAKLIEPLIEVARHTPSAC